MNINKELFIEDVKKIHLLPGEWLMFDGIRQGDVRNVIDLNGTYEYDIEIGRCKNSDDDKVILQRSIDVIYNYTVGRTLLKLLTAKRGLSGRKIGVVNYPGNGSRYHGSMEAVFVNLSLYQPDGSGILERQYYSVDPDGKIVLKRKSLSGSIFHELVHGLHYINDGKYADTVLCQDGSVMKDIWSDDEELRTITGHMCNQPYDPVCDHVFDYSLSEDRFCPRYGHVGWRNGGDENPPNLIENLAGQMMYLGEWRRYQLSDFLPVMKPLPVLKKVQSRVCRYRSTIVKPHAKGNLHKFK
jgi:hypothetical protein